MPAFAEMLVSQSPPVYNYSLVDYISKQTGAGSPFGYSSGPSPPATTRSYCRPASLQLTPPPLRRQQTPPSPLQCSSPMPASPRRSCLVVRPEDLTPEEEHAAIELMAHDAASQDKHRNKKKVVFADDQGGQLTQVRVMKEPSYMPPIWSLQFLAHVTQGMISPVPQEQWVVDFRQPASAYLEFRQKVEEHHVSLENVIIKETEHLIVGTVKVKNLSFNKEVIVRSSCDGWKTHEDTYCTYTVVGSGVASAYTVHDTFSFKLTLPPKSRRIEFCVCYRCDAGEFWDNNDGRNYSLTNRVLPRQETSIFFPSAAYSSNTSNRNNTSSSPLNNNNNNSTNSTNGLSSNNNTNTSLSALSSQYVDPAAELDTWRHMNSESQDGPYCISKARPSSSPSEMSSPQVVSVTSGTPTKTVSRSILESLKVVSSKVLPPSPTPVRRGSCGEEFSNRSQQHKQAQPPAQFERKHRASYPREIPHHNNQMYIRDRKESEDLMVNLLNLRDLMLKQNVHV